MADELDPFRIKVVAHEYLLHAAVIRLMLLDPGFGLDARRWFDIIFGHFSASELSKPFPPQTISALREEYMRMLKRSEEQARIVIGPSGATAVPKPKTIRCRILNGLNVASSRLGLT